MNDAYVGAAFCRPGPSEGYHILSFRRHILVILGLTQNPGSLVYHFWIPGQARNDDGKEVTAATAEKK
ncbi:MAG: hypothetical protein LBL26_05660 [Peptococcaceae bacterium]|nr:hypothetical protein [Peptococcaceae bacterium]